MNKVFLKKSIALALVGITVSTPTLNAVSAMEKETTTPNSVMEEEATTSSNYDTNDTIPREVINNDLSNSPDFIIEDPTKSPYYNNEDYYLNGLNGDERGVFAFLFSKPMLKYAWKSGVVQRIMKWTATAIASAYVGDFAINGFPKMNPNVHIVGYGKYETGNPVKVAQLLLREHGYNINADGYYGPATQSAIKSFQKKYGLKVDGYVGPDTWNKIINTVPK